jgi:hypothetical protein
LKPNAINPFCTQNIHLVATHHLSYYHAENDIGHILSQALPRAKPEPPHVVPSCLIFLAEVSARAKLGGILPVRIVNIDCVGINNNIGLVAVSLWPEGILLEPYISGNPAAGNDFIGWCSLRVRKGYRILSVDMSFPHVLPGGLRKMG